ncbi:hypothetical protein SEA_MORGANA_97 [Gordonia phage Morgana]|uniref:Uncharacterized protein n=1 Tax=Gordonia phage Morgana TaxID=3137292 RepID=A0AAX4RCK6_9CAUD
MSETKTIADFEYDTTPRTAVIEYHEARNKTVTGVTAAVMRDNGTAVLYRTTKDDKLDCAAIIPGGTYAGIFFDEPVESEAAQ